MTPSSQQLVAKVPVILQPGQKGSVGIPLMIPSKIPTGLYTLTLAVYSGGDLIGTSTAELTVTR